MLPVTTPGAEIVFEGTCNFRELGGYRAADGRHVRRGLLYPRLQPGYAAKPR